MTRIVRLEEIDGQLILRVPEDIARKLGVSAGDDVKLKNEDRALKMEPLDGEAAKQWRIALRILEENDEVLAALAR